MKDSIEEANLLIDKTNNIFEFGDQDSENSNEPVLKYYRFGNDINLILKRDSASCLTVHSKFIALGTHLGQIHILDLLGNSIRNKELTPHTTTINDICIDNNGNYIASCSNDGKVVITGLYTSSNNLIHNFDRPIRGVALDPLFSKPGSSMGFIAGDDKLILHEKAAFLPRTKTSILHQGDGPIGIVRWKNQSVAWSTSKGVHVYDMYLKRKISFIARNKQKSSELSSIAANQCFLHWQNDNCLIIGQDDNIQICSVVEKSLPANSISQTSPRDDKTPFRYVEIMYNFRFDFIIIGVAAYNDRCVILSRNKTVDIESSNNDSVTKYEKPHLRTINYKNGEEISNDVLTLLNYEMTNINDYRLECSGSDDVYYVLSNKDVVIALPRDEDDHIDWMIENEKYEQAMNYAEDNAKLLKKHTAKEIGFEWINYLMDKRQFDEAALLCSKIIGRSKEIWEKCVERFKIANQLASIAILLPTNQPRLNPTTYEAVLESFQITKDAYNLHKCINLWPSDVYRIEIVIEMINEYLKSDKSNRLLLESLAKLYALDHKYDQALYLYVLLGHKDLFEMIRRHHLFEGVVNYVPHLMDFDKNLTVKLLVENTDKISAEKVVDKLNSKPPYLFAYLDGLNRQDANATRPYLLRLVQLYCEFNSSQLLAFLRRSNQLPLQEALQLCEKLELHEEAAYLLDRMGNPKQALKTMLRLDDAALKCVEYCQSKNDSELWQDILDYSIDKPDYLSLVLSNVDSHIDTLRLISKIPNGMEIPNLRNSLVRILHDFQLLITLSEGCKKILLSDCIQLARRFIETRRRAMRLDTTSTCPICSQTLLLSSKKSIYFSSNLDCSMVLDAVHVFGCGHNFHAECLSSLSIDIKRGCMICSNGKKESVRL